MAKRTTEMVDPRNSKETRTYSLTKAQLRSEERLIPLTPAPRTGWQKFKRAAVG